MIEIQAKNLEQVARRFKNFPPHLQKSLGGFIEKATLFVLREAKILSTNRVLKKRSGQFSAAITHRIYKERIIGIVGTKHPGARLLEYGGTVKPKKKFLTIPLPGEVATRAGVIKKSTDYHNTFVLKAGGNLIIMGSRTMGAKPSPLFVLKRSATIRAHKLFEITQKTTEPTILKMAQHTVQTEINRSLSD